MLDNNLKAQLGAYLQRLQRPVELRAALDDSEAAQELRQLLKEIGEQSEKISVVEDDGDVAGTDGAPLRRPSFLIANPGVDSGVRFAGVPLGHEFTSLVLALLHVGGHPPKEEADLLEQVRAIDRPLHFETYYSITCHNCPDVVQALNLMAALNPRISHTAIDGGLFAQEVQAREIMGVPAVFLNGQRFGQGRMELGEIIARVDTGASAREAAKISAKEPFDVLIVGGGPAAATAAIYAARKGIRVGLLGERMGGQLLDTVGIENFISLPHTEGAQLAAAMQHHVSGYAVDCMAQQMASALRRTAAGLLEIDTESGAVARARAVILATGARWRNMHVPGEEKYRTKGVTYCPHCDGPLFKGKSVAVIGGGNSGVEAAIDLAGITAHVTLLEFADALKADAVLQARLASLANVTTILNAQTTEVTGDGRKVTGITYTDRASGAQHRVALDGIFVQIGLLPNTGWLQGAVELNAQGEIAIDARGLTNVPGVFAAGDCTDAPYKQIIVAAAGGATAALAAFDWLIRQG